MAEKDTKKAKRVAEDPTPAYFAAAAQTSQFDQASGQSIAQSLANPAESLVAAEEAVDEANLADQEERKKPSLSARQEARRSEGKRGDKTRSEPKKDESEKKSEPAKAEPQKAGPSTPQARPTPSSPPTKSVTQTKSETTATTTKEEKK